MCNVVRIVKTVRVKTVDHNLEYYYNDFDNTFFNDSYLRVNNKKVYPFDIETRCSGDTYTVSFYFKLPTNINKPGTLIFLFNVFDKNNKSVIVSVANESNYICELIKK